MKERFEKNPILYIAILQALFLIVLIIACATKKSTGYTFSANELTAGGNTMVSNMKLGFGSYEVVMNYRTDAEDAGYQIYDDDYMDNAIMGDIYGNFDYTKTSVTVPFWLYHKTDSFFVAWSDTVTMESLTVRSTSALRAEWTLFFTILFLVMDFILYRFIKSASGNPKEIRKNQIFGVIAACTVIVSVPLMINYLLDSRGDISFHLARIEGLYLGLKEGRFPVRMDGFMLNGQGYADPIFYPNLFLYIPAIFRLIGLPILRAYKLFVGIWNLFTCVVAYYSFKRIVKSDKAALVGMILYVMCPYRNLCLYGRGAVGEALAMTFFPLVAAGLYVLLSKNFASIKKSVANKVSKNKENNENETNSEKAAKNESNMNWPEFWDGVILLSLGLTGILQSHVLSCEMIGIMMILLLLVCAKRTFRLNTLLGLVVSALAVILLNTWFLVPFLLSYGMPLYVFDKFDLYVFENALTLYHFFGSPLDLYGQSSILSSDLRDEMGMTLGWAIPLGLLFIGFGIRTCLKYRRTEKGKVLPICMILGVIASWITTYFFPWKQVENLPVIGKLLCMVQFPWRYLGIASFCFSLAIVVYLAILEEEVKISVSAGRNEKRLWAYYIALVALTVLLAQIHYHSLIRQTEYFAPYSETGLNQGRTMIQAEYLYSDTTIAELREAARVDRGYRRNNCTLYFDIVQPNADAIEVATPLTYYPYYVAKDVSTGQRFDIMKGNKGTAIIYVPAEYSGTIKFYLPEAKKWLAGDIVSVLALAGLIALIVILAKKRNQVKPKLEEAINEQETK